MKSGFFLDARLSTGYTHEINKNNVQIKGYLGNQNNIATPDRIEGYPVTSIDSKAFRDNKNSLVEY